LCLFSLVLFCCGCYVDKALYPNFSSS
jgi:hypothetical protein